MKIPGSKKISSKKKTISKEFLIGLLALVLGGYNLLTSFGVISVFVEIPQIIANILLVLAGIFLWVTAYKLSRYKYHTSRVF
ncbi:hypothetical protein KY348_03350 [Candidatus Woesearchaeota archaeon]|nr:hypothetical protein [Candidatus Woesearchaeota archaeon]